MATVQIGIKIEESVKARIDEMVSRGLYRTTSDFIHRAIAAELERDGATTNEYLKQEVYRQLSDDMLKGAFDVVMEKKIRYILSQVAGPESDRD